MSFIQDRNITLLQDSQRAFQTVYYFSDGRGNNATQEFYYSTFARFQGFDAVDATHLDMFFSSIKGNFTDVVRLQIASNTHKKVVDTLYKQFTYNNAAPLAAGADPIVTVIDKTSGSAYSLMTEIEDVSITLGTSNTYGLLGCAFTTGTATNVNDNSSQVVIPFETQTFLDAGFVNTSNTDKTVLNAGRYRIHCQLGVYDTTANYRWTANLNIRKNGAIVSTITGAYLRASGASFNTELIIDRQMALAANDVISISTLRVSSVSGAAVLVPAECALHITRLQ